MTSAIPSFAKKNFMSRRPQTRCRRCVSPSWRESSSDSWPNAKCGRAVSARLPPQDSFFVAPDALMYLRSSNRGGAGGGVSPEFLVLDISGFLQRLARARMPRPRGRCFSSGNAMFCVLSGCCWSLVRPRRLQSDDKQAGDADQGGAYRGCSRVKLSTWPQNRQKCAQKLPISPQHRCKTEAGPAPRRFRPGGARRAGIAGAALDRFCSTPP